MDADPENLPGLGSGWGAMSEYAVVHDPLSYPEGEAPDCAYAQTVLDEDLDPVDAAMIVTFREVLSNIRYFGIKPEDSVVVFGCGPVGLTYIKFLSLIGVTKLVACDILPAKLEQAKTYGANYFINSKEQDVTAEVRKLFPEGVDFVLDAAGFPAIVNQGMSLIKDRGTIDPKTDAALTALEKLTGESDSLIPELNNTKDTLVKLNATTNSILNTLEESGADITSQEHQDLAGQP